MSRYTWPNHQRIGKDRGAEWASLVLGCDRAERPFHPSLNPPVEVPRATCFAAALCLLLWPVPLGRQPSPTSWTANRHRFFSASARGGSCAARFHQPSRLPPLRAPRFFPDAPTPRRRVSASVVAIPRLSTLNSQLFAIAAHVCSVFNTEIVRLFNMLLPDVQSPVDPE